MTYQAARRPYADYGTDRAPARADKTRDFSRTVTADARASRMTREEMRKIREEEYRRAVRAEMLAEQKRRARELDRKRRLEAAKAYEATLKREEAAARKAEKAREKEAERLAEEAFRRSEIKVEKKKMPWQFILGVAAAFVLLMAMVFSFAQLSESNAVLADLNAQIKATEAHADKLRLQLEEKNDLDLIEELAVNEYNMIKEGSARKKYISVSEGDRVVLEAEEEASEGGFMNQMLSSVATVFDDLIDYIK